MNYQKKKVKQKLLLNFFDLKTYDTMAKNQLIINAQKRTDAPAKRLNASLR